jgi:hypothetical protein
MHVRSCYQVCCWLVESSRMGAFHVLQEGGVRAAQDCRWQVGCGSRWQGGRRSRCCCSGHPYWREHPQGESLRQQQMLQHTQQQHLEGVQQTKAQASGSSPSSQALSHKEMAAAVQEHSDAARRPSAERGSARRSSQHPGAPLF